MPPQTSGPSFAKAQSDAQGKRITEKQASSGAPFLAGITSVDTQNDTLEVTYFGSRSVKIPHPYLGITAWHRVGPEPGMALLMQSRTDSAEPEGFLYYLPRTRLDAPNKRILDFTAGTDVYRPLQRGEQELSSRGYAQIYMSHRPVLDLRGGYVRSWYDQGRIEFGAKAATHRFVLNRNSPDLIGDELRWGVVTRPKTATTSNGQTSTGNKKSTIDVDFIKDGTGFAREYSYILKSGNAENPRLVDHREGNVIDDDGKAMKGNARYNLRYKKTLYNTDNEKIEFQVDEKGNIFVSLPDAAEDGVKLTIPKGNFFAEINDSASTVNWSCGNDYTVSAKSAVKIESINSVSKFLGTKVKLGTNEASEPLILGNTYKDAEKQLIDQLKDLENSTVQSLTMATSVLQGMSSGLQPFSALPFVPGAVFVQVLDKIISAIKEGFQTQKQAAQQKSSSYSSFNSNYASYLSKVVKTA